MASGRIDMKEKRSNRRLMRGHRMNDVSMSGITNGKAFRDMKSQLEEYRADRKENWYTTSWRSLTISPKVDQSLTEGAWEGG